MIPVILHHFLLFYKRFRNYNSYIDLLGGRKMLIYDFRVIGNRLLAFRKKAGLTQIEVAEAAGLSDRTYADIERGSVNMRIETILRICDVLHIIVVRHIRCISNALYFCAVVTNR